MTPQAKKLVMNIGTGALVLGTVVGGYFVFFNKTDTTTTAVSKPSVSVEQAIVVSSNISRTKTELSDLRKAVAASVEVFSSHEFRSLQDFSQQVPEEPIGRDNPFMATGWKIKMVADEAAAGKKTASTGGGSSASTPGVVVVPSTMSPLTAGNASVTTGI